MSQAHHPCDDRLLEEAPLELKRLRERINRLPASYRGELASIARDAAEQAVFRSRALNLAKLALQDYRMNVALLRFDLDATKLERDELIRERAPRGPATN